MARTCGDKLTLQACVRYGEKCLCQAMQRNIGLFSLLNRLPPTERGCKPVINEIQPDLHPYEILRDAEKLMHVGNVRQISRV